MSSRLSEIADWIERDRREPDKVLCNVQSLRRAIREHEEQSAQKWNEAMDQFVSIGRDK